MKPTETAFFSVVAACIALVLCVLIFAIYKDAQAGKAVNIECIKAGGRAGFDVKNDGLGSRKGCIFN